jgi:formylglycine-generating enzyme required for sulfatase activity
MFNWSGITPDVVNVGALAQVIRDAGKPVHVDVLAQAAVRALLEAEERRYAPGAQYAPGETIRCNGQLVKVKAVQDGSNLKQGSFKILTLALPDGAERNLAAEVAGAPAEDQEPVTDQKVRVIADGENGLAIRTTVQEALAADDRFVRFQDAQGDHWYLTELLPPMTDQDLARAWTLLQGLLNEGVLFPRPTEALVGAIWGQANDGSDAYLLRAFALNVALQRCRETRWVGDGWALEAEWQQLQERPTLVGPREENVVTLPEGVAPDAEAETDDIGEDVEAEVEPEESGVALEQDLEAWRRDRRLNATITLQARHYYENWLPLSQDVQRVFPPLSSEACAVTFYHRFGGEEESFRAWVDWNQKIILGSPQMYQTFYNHGIYPGARLVISHRGTLWNYDLRTRPVAGEERLRVRRVFLSETGELEYEEIDEPLRYEVDGDVFVAAARWEDLPALFEQAERVGAGIFQLMYERCCQWWEQGGREPLHVTAQQLFGAIHYDDQGRLTRKATIAWELWRRSAFEPVGDERYLFHPEKGDRTRSVGLRQRSTPRRSVLSGPRVERDRSLEQIAQATEEAEPPIQQVDVTESILPEISPEEAEFQQIQEIVRTSLVGQTVHTLTGRPNRIAQAGEEGLGDTHEPPSPPKRKKQSELFDALSSDDVDQVQQIISRLVKQASPDIVHSLADLVETYFSDVPSVWVDHLGNVHELRRTALNLTTLCQKRAVLALAKMTVPEATKVLDRWTPPGMILIPAGSFTMGSTENDNEGPVHEVWLDAFWIDRYPVTNAQWAAFMEDGGYERRTLWTKTGWKWKENKFPRPAGWVELKHRSDHPVVGISWYEALAYANWAGKSLLSEAQWEKAARGDQKHKYPWGDEFDEKKCNTRESGTLDTTPVEKYSPQGDSLYGVADMVGNVWEWCCNRYTHYPYESASSCEVLESTGVRMLRGGAYDVQKLVARVTYRDRYLPSVRLRSNGVRLGITTSCPLQGDILAPQRAESTVSRPIDLTPPEPAVARTRSGQLVAVDLIPKGPLFDSQTKARDESPEPPPPKRVFEATLPSPPSKPPAPALRTRSRRDEMQAKTLFSSHYLETRLSDHPEWAEDPRAVFEAVRQLWEKARQYGQNWNEAQTEEEFVKPVLEVLGWAFVVQPKAGSKGRVTRPDYALFESAQARDKAYPHLGNDDPFYTRALAIAEAKYWGRPLSQKEPVLSMSKDQSGRNTWKVGSNPSHQMVNYLVGTRAPWGILTNGQVWRLYSREVSSTASEYYEIDLSEIFDQPNLPITQSTALFKRWWLFFRRDAFIPDPQGKSFVQRVHEGSATYAREISDKLKELVFEQVVPEIAGGFVAYRHHQRGVRQETEESLREIYQATLSLLYKLLFLLYAEARGLLPIHNPGYRESSLTTLAQWAAERLDKKLALSDATHATARYDALLALFHRVDQGDPSLGVPRYNGGLFNPASPENRFLEEHKLSDRTVARAVDTLVRDAGRPVDYAYISVRNLGAIYEGLLENKLRVTDRPPRSAETSEVCWVELVDDKGERKASGSYYTPDYIVAYIVQHTLDPILDERQARFQAAMDRCADLRRQLQRTDDKTRVSLLRERLDEAEREAREAFLGVKVCDPAMGSGHFLVNAVDHLTDGIIQRMQTYHDAHPDVPWDWNPIQRLVERVRGEILAEMARQGIAVDPDRLDDTALLTRLVMKRCIYGVDLNPLAVELAKLSLWLHSFTVGAPLSFLDHHLRWGNSLIGTDVRAVEREIRETDKGGAVQLGLFAGPFAGLLDLTALMTEVAEQADATLADVQRSAETFERFQQALTPYKQVLDLWVGQHFGNPEARNFLTLYGGDVLPALRGEKQTAENYQAVIEQARALWREKRFFHWDLEFPEIFVDLHRRDWAENPGFDAVVGNPPYVRSIRLKDADPEAWAYYTQNYQAAAKREYDIYLCFAEQGLELLNSFGHFGMIMPNKWFTTRVGESLRSLLSERQVIEHVVDFGHFQVFEEVTTYTCLLFLSGSLLDRVQVAVLDRADKDVRPLPGSDGGWQAGTVTTKTLGAAPWTFALGPAGSLLEKLEDLPRLEEIATVFKGTGTSADYVFMMERQGNRFYSRSLEQWIEIEDDLMRPSLTGRDIDPYHYEAQNHLLFPYRFVDNEAHLIPPDEMATKYPKAWTYLKHPTNRASLEGRDKGAFRNRADWYAYGRPQNMHLLGMNKLVGPDVAGEAEFACDLEGRYIIDTVYGIRLKENERVSLLALATLLNSPMMTFFLQQTGTNLRGGYFRMKTAYLNPFPVPRIDFTTPADERQRYVKQGQRLYTDFRSLPDFGSLKDFVAHHLDAGRSDVVHDLLAHLAEQMIEMNKEKQDYLRTFRLDLAGYLDEKQQQKLNRLYTPKKPPQEGAKHYDQRLVTYEQAVALARAQLGPLADEILALEDFWRLNQAQWMWLLRQNLGQVDGMNRLVALHERYRAQLAPLMRRLQRTDWLIDQIVYQLYGLTEEEIAIVEGQA